MSTPIRFELTGKNADAWNRVFETLTNVIMEGMAAFAPDHDDETERAEHSQFLIDIAELSKGWLKARIERPALENEKLAVEILERFEEIKLKQAQRKGIEIENESKLLDLSVKRVETAVKLLGLLNNSFHYQNGVLTLILTNENLAMLHADVKALKQDSEQSAEPTS